MTPKELEEYRNQLQALAKRFHSQVTLASRRAMQIVDDSDADVSREQVERGNADFSAEQNIDVLVAEQQLLSDVNIAMGKIEAGTFGRCEQCGVQIAKARLEAMPYARHCITCAKELSNEPGTT